MPTEVQLFSLLTGSGGALAALIMWNRDLIKQRDYERARNSELTDRYAASTMAGNEAIRDLTDAVLDATDVVLAQSQSEAPMTRPRRRPTSAR